MTDFYDLEVGSTITLNGVTFDVFADVVADESLVNEGKTGDTCTLSYFREYLLKDGKIGSDEQCVSLCKGERDDTMGSFEPFGDEKDLYDEVVRHLECRISGTFLPACFTPNPEDHCLVFGLRNESGKVYFATQERVKEMIFEDELMAENEEDFQAVTEE